MNSTKTFYSKLAIFSLVVGVIFFFLEPSFTERSAFADHAYIQIFMIIVTVLFHRGLINAGEKSDQAFIRFFMGATGVKLFLFMVIMMIFGLLNKEQAFGFILHFFIYYLLYTTFEVAFIYKRLSGTKSSQGK